MAATKSLVSQATLVLLVLALVVQTQAQTCSNMLGNLDTCAPYVLPGASAPSTECCSALQAIDHECLCNTLRVSAQLPTQCKLPSLSCPAN